MSLQVSTLATLREKPGSITKSDSNRGKSRKSTSVIICHPEAKPVMTSTIPKTFKGRKTLHFIGQGGSPTLADVIALLAKDTSFKDTRRRDLISALKRVAAACDRPPSQIPADPNWLRQKLSGSSPISLGQSKKTRANVLSNALAALAAVGVAKRRPVAARSPEWQALWICLGTTARIVLGSFTKFCTFHQILPEQVTDDVISRYREAVILSSLRKKPDELIHDLTIHWNRCAATIPGWPKHRVTVINRRVLIAPPENTLPQSFVDDVDNYLSDRASTNVLDDSAAPTLASATIKHRRSQIRRFFGELVADGVSPNELLNLRAIVEPQMAYRGLKAILDRRNGATSGMIHHMACMLLVIAKHYVRLNDDDLQKLRTACRKLKVSSSGMTEKNRHRLRQLSDKKNLNRILLLPEELEREARHLPPQRAAALVETALAIELLTMTALRIKNVASLHVEINLNWTRSSWRGVCHLVVDGRHVKNGVDREYELQPETTRLLKVYLDEHRHHLCASPGDWIFPRRDGNGPVSPIVLSRRISKTIRDRTGLTVNAHLFRSLAAMIYLNHNPGGYEVTRQLLGHKPLATTTTAYTGMETVSANKQFDRTIRQSRDRARAARDNIKTARKS